MELFEQDKQPREGAGTNSAGIVIPGLLCLCLEFPLRRLPLSAHEHHLAGHAVRSGVPSRGNLFGEAYGEFVDRHDDYEFGRIADSHFDHTQGDGGYGGPVGLPPVGITQFHHVCPVLAVLGTNDGDCKGNRTSQGNE